MIRLRLVRSNRWRLTNCCWYITEHGTVMAGSSYCTNVCPHYRGTVNLWLAKFVKCNFWNL